MTVDATARAVAAKTRLVFNISGDMHGSHDASQVGFNQQSPSPSSPSFVVDAGNADYDEGASTSEEGWHITPGDGRHMPKRSASRTEGSTTGEAGGSPRSRRGGAGRVEEPVREGGELLSLAPAHASGNRKPLMLTPAAEVKGKGSGEGGSKEERHLSRAVVRPSSASGKGTGHMKSPSADPKERASSGNNALQRTPGPDANTKGASWDPAGNRIIDSEREHTGVSVATIWPPATAGPLTGAAGAGSARPVGEEAPGQRTKGERMKPEEDHSSAATSEKGKASSGPQRSAGSAETTAADGADSKRGWENAAVSLSGGNDESSSMTGDQSESSEDQEEQLSPLLDAPIEESPREIQSEDGGEEEEREFDEEEGSPEEDECEPGMKRVRFRGSISVRHAASVSITVNIGSQNRGLKRAFEGETEDHGAHVSTNPDSRAWINTPKRQTPNVP